MRARDRLLRGRASPALLVCALWTASAMGQVETAGELLVSLDAVGDPTAGTDTWANSGTLGDFVRIGTPTLVTVDGAQGVELAQGSAYQCQDIAPAGLVGEDPTRTVEAWVYNAEISTEETICAWSHRGGPCGSNMSFNYGTDQYFGAVGHWCHLPGPDMGWGTVPIAARWHHLVYTYDGTTTRVYADGVQTNEEALGGGIVVTHDGSPIVLAAQYADAAGTLEFGANVNTITIGRLRVHDGVLTQDQILSNYELERPEFPFPPVAPAFGAAPTGQIYAVGADVYSYQLTVTGIPAPTLEVLSPEGGTVSGSGRFEYAIPDPEPESFTVTVKATNEAGSAETTWTVIRIAVDALAIVGDLFVSLDAEDPSAGTDSWTNQGSLGAFAKVGNPIVKEYAGVIGVAFNETGRIGESYVSTADAPAGIIGGEDRTIETWVYNPAVDANEETILSFGRRGGPEGSNMSFNYAQNGAYGAVGHWGNPDLGWGPQGAPTGAQWHHLVYTYDGASTHVYADGEQWNSELLGAPLVTHPGRIALAAQWLPDGIGFENGIGGDLAIARVRVHDGALTPNQVKQNYIFELGDFSSAPAFSGVPDQEEILTGTATYSRTVLASGIPVPTLEVLAPAGATISQGGVVSYEVPSPEPDGFDVTVRATNPGGTAEATWTVVIVKPAMLVSGPVHRYPFTADASDEVGEADGTAYGNVVFADGQADFQNDGSQGSAGAGLFPDPADPEKLPPGAYIDLPNGIVSSLGTKATFEAWFTWRGPYTSVWQRVFDFGVSDAGEDSSGGAPNSSYIMLTPRSGATTTRAGYRVGATANERWVETLPVQRSVEKHVVLTWDDDAAVARLYVDGVLVSEDAAKHLTLAGTVDSNNWLGRANWGDPLYNGLLNEFRIYDRVLSYQEVLGNFESGADVVNLEPQGPVFRRGDANNDGVIDLSDGVSIFNFLFLGGSEPACLAAADTNLQGEVNITSGIYVLNFLFTGGPEPPAPFPDCGMSEAASDVALGCVDTSACD